MNVEHLEALVTRYRELDHERRPFVVGVLGDFSGEAPERPPARQRRFVDVRWETFEAFLGALRPWVSLIVPDRIRGEGEVLVELEFSGLEDFHPRGLLRSDLFCDRLGSAPAGVSRAELDRRLRAQVDAVLHHDQFRRLEASWRGLYHLVARLSSGPLVRVRVLDLSRQELDKTLKEFRGVAWDQSPLFKQVYEEELGTFGGHPFSLLIGDYEFCHVPRDIGTLDQLSMIAAASHAVFLASAAPELLGESDFAKAADLRDPERLFHAAEYLAWRSLCAAADSDHLALALPRVLLRAPYEEVRDEASGLVYREDDSGGLWGNPAFVVGADLMNSFARHRCFATLEGIPHGGVVSGLPVLNRVARGRVVKSSLEIQFPSHLRGQLEAAGLIPMYRRGDSDRVAYTRARSLGGPPDRFLASTMLVGRVVHGLRAWGRTLRGTTSNPLDFAQALDLWLRRERTPSEAPDLAERIRHPLREARMEQNYDSRELQEFRTTETLSVRLECRPHPPDR